MTRKLRCIAVDDDIFIIEMLHELFKHSPYAEIIKSFTSPKKYLEALPTLEYDVCLLDIEMPEMDGLNVARQLNRKPVIFVTGEEKMLKNALDMSPIDIITKPILKSRFNEAISKAYILLKGNLNDDREYRFFNVAGSKEKVRLKLADIFLVTTDNADTDYKYVFLKNGSSYTIKDCTLEEFCQFSKSLIQPNKSELISIEAINKIAGNRTIFLNKIKKNGTPRKVMLSRSYKKRFMDRV